MIRPFPVRFWRGHLLFDHLLRPHAVYRIPLIPYAHLGVAQKQRTMAALAEFLIAYRGRGQWLSVCREISPDGISAALELLGAHRHLPDLGARYARAVVERLGATKPWRRELYLVASLPASRGVGRIASRARNLRELIGAIEEEFLPGEGIPAALLETAAGAERLAGRAVESILGGRPAAEAEIKWLIARNAWRGAGEPPRLLGRGPRAVQAGGAWRAGEGAVTSLVASHVTEEHLFHIRVQDGAGGPFAYQAFLPLADGPEEIDCPGQEWLFWLEELEFPVDAAVHFHVEPPHIASRALAGRRRALADQQREFDGAAEAVPLQLRWAGERALGLEENFRRGVPLVWSTAILGVGAPDLEVLRQRVDRLLQLYLPAQFRLVWPPGDQFACHASFIPGAEPPRAWSLPSEPDYLAASLLHAGHQLGDPSGWYLGRLPSGLPVFLDPDRPMRELNRSGAVGLVGTLGGGKSVLKKLLMLFTLLGGGAVFALDPKGEDQALLQIPEVAVIASRLDLGPDSTTRFNPYRIGGTPERARAVALDFLGILLGTGAASQAESRSLVLHEVVERVMRAGRPDLAATVRCLDQLAASDPDRGKRDEARRCAALLRAAEKTPWGRMAFAPHAFADGRNASRCVLVSLAGLPLPRPRVRDDPQPLTEGERLGVALMFLVAALGREFLLSRPKEQLKLFPCDEAWALLRVAEGERLLADITRMGRSFNIAPVLATQNASDLRSEVIRNNLGMLFCFRMEDAREIEDCAALLGLEQTDELRARFRNLAPGQAYLRDAEGRVGLMQVEVLPTDLLAVLGTTPGVTASASATDE